MSERWPQFDSEQTKLESQAADDSSANGVNPEYAVGVAEQPDEQATVADGELTDDATTASEPTGETPVAEAVADEALAEAAEDAPLAEGVADQAPAEAVADDAPAAAVEDAPAVAASLAADDGSTFLVELVLVMRATAGVERIRIGEDIDRRRQERVDQVQARKASEADRMRELAAEDMAAIEAWVDRETARIKLERERRATAVREDLDTSLAEHGSKIDLEIQAIETAIATYRAEVEAYFEGLDRETDPIHIAQKAARRPVFPELDAVAATTADVVEAEPASPDQAALVGVMDPAAPAEPVESWVSSPETSPEPESAEGVDDNNQAGAAPQSSDAVTAGVSPNNGTSGGLLKAVPAKRPMSWLWRSED